MSTWFSKFSEHLSDKKTIERNKKRLENLKQYLFDLSRVCYMSQGNSFYKIKDLLEEPIVKGRKKIYEKIKSALIGENNQKLVMDSPFEVEKLLREAIELVDKELGKETKDLNNLLRKEKEKKDKEKKEDEDE